MGRVFIRVVLDVILLINRPDEYAALAFRAIITEPLCHVIYSNEILGERLEKAVLNFTSLMSYYRILKRAA